MEVLLYGDNCQKVTFTPESLTMSSIKGQKMAKNKLSTWVEQVTRRVLVEGYEVEVNPNIPLG